jgi:hypothetical protein
MSQPKTQSGSAYSQGKSQWQALRIVLLAAVTRFGDELRGQRLFHSVDQLLEREGFGQEGNLLAIFR